MLPCSRCGFRTTAIRCATATSGFDGYDIRAEAASFSYPVTGARERDPGLEYSLELLVGQCSSRDRLTTTGNCPTNNLQLITWIPSARPRCQLQPFGIALNVSLRRRGESNISSRPNPRTLSSFAPALRKAFPARQWIPRRSGPPFSLPSRYPARAPGIASPTRCRPES
jgi:hypothetical protein